MPDYDSVEYGHTDTDLPNTFPSQTQRFKFYQYYLRHTMPSSSCITLEDVNNEDFLLDFDVSITSRTICLIYAVVH